jgi:hypothetical protein
VVDREVVATAQEVPPVVEVVVDREVVATAVQSARTGLLDEVGSLRREEGHEEQQRRRRASRQRRRGDTRKRDEKLAVQPKSNTNNYDGDPKLEIQFQCSTWPIDVINHWMLLTLSKTEPHCMTLRSPKVWSNLGRSTMENYATLMGVIHDLTIHDKTPIWTVLRDRSMQLPFLPVFKSNWMGPQRSDRWGRFGGKPDQIETGSIRRGAAGEWLSSQLINGFFRCIVFAQRGRELQEMKTEDYRLVSRLQPGRDEEKKRPFLCCTYFFTSISNPDHKDGYMNTYSDYAKHLRPPELECHVKNFQMSRHHCGTDQHR